MNIEIIRTNPLDNNLDSTKQFGLFLNSILSSVKMMHWYAMDYNNHQIFGNLYDSLEKLFDDLQEEIIGTSKESKIPFPSINTNNVNLANIQSYNDKQTVLELYQELISQVRNNLCNLDFMNYLNSVNSGINNIKEEILSAINKANYLLSLNDR